MLTRPSLRRPARRPAGTGLRPDYSRGSAIRRALPAETAAHDAGRVRGHLDLAIAVRGGGETELHPRTVVRVVRLGEHLRVVRSRDEVVVRRIRHAGQVELLPLGRLVVLVDPAGLDPL